MGGRAGKRMGGDEMVGDDEGGDVESTVGGPGVLWERGW